MLLAARQALRHVAADAMSSEAPVSAKQRIRIATDLDHLGAQAEGLQLLKEARVLMKGAHARGGDGGDGTMVTALTVVVQEELVGVQKGIVVAEAEELGVPEEVEAALMMI
jgi:hypothetical protein